MTARNHWSAQRRKSLSDEIAELREPIGAWKDLLEQKISWVDAEGAKRYGTGVRVVVFDPSLDAIATYHGPLDDATGDIPAWVDNVAVSVPGTGATMAAFANDDARLLQESAGRTSAVFQWAGGTFPGSIPEAMTWGYSENLAPKLRDFVGAIARSAWLRAHCARSQLRWGRPWDLRKRRASMLIGFCTWLLPGWDMEYQVLRTSRTRVTCRTTR